MVKRNRKTTEQFVEESKIVHGDRFDYSKVNYINNKLKVIIGCKIHGYFEQRPSSHLFGYGCHECLKENRNPYRGKEKEYENKYIESAKIIHGEKYDYSLVNYIHKDQKVDIICQNHGVFQQSLYEHGIRGSGCPKCVGKFRTNDEFIELSKNIHNNKYDYSLCEYVNTNSIVKIICPKHGEFSQKALYHLDGNGCYRCRESNGEKRISNILNEYGIKYETQKRFDGCVYKYKLAFDFYLPDYNICIEYNGIQHYEPLDIFGGYSEFLIRLERDKIKMEYCNNNNIPLIIIKYDEDINSILYNRIKLIYA